MTSRVHEGNPFLAMEYVEGSNLEPGARPVGPVLAGGGGRADRPGAGCARLRARPRHRASRREAGEHPAAVRPAGEDDRFRHLAARHLWPDAGRLGDRHTELHVAGAMPRRAGGCAQRPVLRRGRAVRAAERRAAVHRPQHDRDRLAGDEPAATRHPHHRSRPDAVAGRGDRTRPGQAARGSLRDRRRHGGIAQAIGSSRCRTIRRTARWSCRAGRRRSPRRRSARSSANWPSTSVRSHIIWCRARRGTPVRSRNCARSSRSGSTSRNSAPASARI